MSRNILKEQDNDPWVSIALKVRKSELPLANQRLKLYGYETAGQLFKDFIHSKFPVLTEDKQIDNLYQNQSGKSQQTYTIGDGGKEFYENVDLNDFYTYCLNVRKLSANTCRDIVSYFKRFRDQFFTDAGIDEIRKLSPRIRSKIMDAFRKFGLYYFYKYNNDQVIDLVSRIIRRHNLSFGNSEYGKLYIVDNNYLEDKLKKVFELNGELGLIVKFALYSGLREEELVYLHHREVCPDKSGCGCDKLHIIEKGDYSVILIQWHRGHKKCYFTIAPTALLKEFKSLDRFEYNPHIKSAHGYLKTKDVNLNFMWLRKAHYNVMCRVMKPFEANILAGRAKSVDAKHYAMYELDEMTSKYEEAWNKFNVSLIQN